MMVIKEEKNGRALRPARSTTLTSVYRSPGEGLTAVVQKNHLATSQLRIDLMQLQSGVDSKLAEGDFDPAIMQCKPWMS